MKDKRYSIIAEYCGYSTQRFVIRFCGHFIAQRETFKQAIDYAKFHKAHRI